jgi:hypothetical protein
METQDKCVFASFLNRNKRSVYRTEINAVDGTAVA